MKDTTLARQRTEAARRQREYRARQSRILAELQARQHEDNLLEDSIKLSAGLGDPMAREIIERAPALDAPALANFFQSRAALYQLSRKPARNTKKNTTAKRNAAVFL